MSLVARLSGGDKPIRHEVFWSSLMEWYFGEITKADVVAYFQLDADEQAELDWLAQRFLNTAAQKREFVERVKGIMVMAKWQFPGYRTVDEVTAKIQGIG